MASVAWRQGVVSHGGPWTAGGCFHCRVRLGHRGAPPVEGAAGFAGFSDCVGFPILIDPLPSSFSAQSLRPLQFDPPPRLTPTIATGCGSIDGQQWARNPAAGTAHPAATRPQPAAGRAGQGRGAAESGRGQGIGRGAAESGRGVETFRLRGLCGLCRSCRL
jgi:hypothetical protein